jgi:hypothetical protein
MRPAAATDNFTLSSDNTRLPSSSAATAAGSAAGPRASTRPRGQDRAEQVAGVKGCGTTRIPTSAPAKRGAKRSRSLGHMPLVSRDCPRSAERPVQPPADAIPAAAEAARQRISCTARARRYP